MTDTVTLPREVMEQALRALESCRSEIDGKWYYATSLDPKTIKEGIAALRAALDAPQASAPNPIYYMRDEQTFKRLSDNVDTALDEIRDEFSQGYSYGSLCSKRKNFKMIHAGGSDQLEPFLAECRTALAPQAMPAGDLTHACEIELVTGKKCAKQCTFCASGIAMLTAAPPAAKAQQTHGLLLWATLDEALDAYWSAAYAEGQRGATHDTKDGRAQCALEAVRSCVRLAVAAEREACAKVCDAGRASIWEYHEPYVKSLAATVCENLAAKIRAV